MIMKKNTIALVTGGCSGLGAGTVHELMKLSGIIRGVVVADLPSQQEQYNELVHHMKQQREQQKQRIQQEQQQQQIHQQHNHQEQQLHFFPTDVTCRENVISTLDRIEETFGNKEEEEEEDGSTTSNNNVANVVVNCAGMALAQKTYSSKRGAPHNIDDFIRTLHVNTVGTFQVASLAAERMIINKKKKKKQKKKEGEENNNNNNNAKNNNNDDDDNDDDTNYCIINTASIAGYEGQIGQVAYAASKGAIIGMTLPMARDLATEGIRVMTIAPGIFETPLLSDLPDHVKQELGQTIPYPSRLGKASEFGQLVCSIIQNPMLNGSVIRLDGALRMPPS